MTTRHKRFHEWSDAEEWATENDKILEPCGSFTGEESTVAQHSDGDNSVELWKRVAEVYAIGARYTQIIHVTEYGVATITPNSQDIYYANDVTDAHDYYRAQFDRIWTTVSN